MSAMDDAGRLLVSGDRRFCDEGAVRDGLSLGLSLLQAANGSKQLPLLVHGAAHGLDSLAATVAATWDWEVEARPAKWSEHDALCPPYHAGQATCKMAGHRRNAEMLDPRPGLLVAFPLHKRALTPGTDRRMTSRGTWSMVSLAMRAQVPTVVLWRGRFHPADQAAAAMLAAHVAPCGEPVRPRPDGSVGVDEALMPF